MIGILFAASYVYLLSTFLENLKSKVLKGTIFGLAVFIFAQIMMAVSGALMGGMPSPEGGMIPMMIGSVIGHMIYGVIVAFLVKNN